MLQMHGKKLLQMEAHRQIQPNAMGIVQLYMMIVCIFLEVTTTTVMNDLHRYRLIPGPMKRPSLKGTSPMDTICQVHSGADIEYTLEYLELHYKDLPAKICEPSKHNRVVGGYHKQTIWFMQYDGLSKM